MSSDPAPGGTILSIALFRGARDNEVRPPENMIWPDDFLAFCDADGSPGSKEATPGFLLGRFKPGKGREKRQTVANLGPMIGLGWDFDPKFNVTIPQAEKAFQEAGFEYVLCTSFSHLDHKTQVEKEAIKPEEPARHSFRILTLTTREMTTSESRLLQEILCDGMSLPIEVLSPAQMYFRATRRTDMPHEPIAKYVPGNRIDPDAVFKAADRYPNEAPSHDRPAARGEAPGKVSGQAAALLTAAAAARARRQEDPNAKTDKLDEGLARVGQEHLPAIERQCQFMRYGREHAEQMGNPEWRSWGSVLNRCKDGRETAHEVGARHATYSYDDTERMLDRLAAEVTGPHTCATIRKYRHHEGGKSICDGCPLGIPIGTTTSPILLGVPDPAVDPPEVVAEYEQGDAEREIEAARKRLADASSKLDEATQAVSVAKINRKNVEHSVAADVKAAAEQVLNDALSLQRIAKAEFDREKRTASKEERAYVLFTDGVKAGAHPHVLRKLTRGAKEKPLSNRSNLRLVMDFDLTFRDLKYDLFQERIYKGDTEVKDEDTTNDIADLELKYGFEDVKKGHYEECILAKAHIREFHPIRDYLDGLIWDRKPRLHDLMEKGFGAITKDTDGPQYLSEAGRKFCISAVARIYEPGCKVDEVVVFTGAEGKKKSTGLEILALGWSASSHIDIKSKDGVMAIGGVWIYELAELDSTKRAEHATVRNFISTKKDRIRLPYAKTMSDRPRQGILGATCNDREFLNDPNGSRRFIPIEVSTVDIAWLRDNVEQLWAEAVVLYRAGVIWHYDEADGSKQRLLEVSQKHIEEEAWTNIIAAHLYHVGGKKKQETIDPTDILRNLLEFPWERINDHTKGRVTRVLRALGCTQYHPPPTGGKRPPRTWLIPESFKIDPNASDPRNASPDGGKLFPGSPGAPKNPKPLEN